MGTESYDDLLRRLPEIAKVVNAFTSEDVQMQVFRALVDSLGATDRDAAQDRGKPDESTRRGQGAPRQRASKNAADGEAPAKKSAPGRRGSASGFNMLSELNLDPPGKRSLKDFMAASKPKNQNEQCLAAVYWCSHEAGITPVTGDHVFTCFRGMAWRLPSDLLNKISKNVGKGWLTSGKREDIVLGVNGLNYVEHEMLKRPATGS